MHYKYLYQIFILKKYNQTLNMHGPIFMIYDLEVILIDQNDLLAKCSYKFDTGLTFCRAFFPDLNLNNQT